MKLKGKSRVGSKISKTYDQPQTPYARVPHSPSVSDHDKVQLRENCEVLDLVQFPHQIDDLQCQLLASVSIL